MRAIVQDGYEPAGSDLRMQEVATPTLGDDDVLVRVRATSANTYGWDVPSWLGFAAACAARRRPPEARIPGLDVAGVVDDIGPRVTRFEPGDEVFGWADGAFADCVAAPEGALVTKPTTISYDQAAIVPIAGFAALQSLRDQGGIEAGQRVLVIGASGGVGLLAVQIAKHYGAEVTGVCSTHNLDTVRRSGADQVIDYTREDFSQTGQQYDLILDMAGDRSLSALRRALTPDGTLVMVGGAALTRSSWLRGFGRWMAATVLSWRSDQTLRACISRRRRADLVALADLIEAGEIVPVVSERYSFADAPTALDGLATGHGKGRVAITC